MDLDTIKAEHPDTYRAAVEEGRAAALAERAAASGDAHAEGLTAGIAQGERTERDRILAILALPGSLGNPKQALAIVHAGLSPEQAKEIFAAANSPAASEETTRAEGTEARQARIREKFERLASASPADPEEAARRLKEAAEQKHQARLQAHHHPLRGLW